MTLSQEQEKALRNYVMQHDGGNITINPTQLKEILRINIQDNQLFGFELLKIENLNKEEFALIVGMDCICNGNHPIDFHKFTFLKSIYFSEWHHEHKNIIDTFSRVISCDYIDFLFEAIKFIPQYQIGFEECSIVRRAFFGLGRNISCPKALQYLKLFQHDSDPIFQMFANEQLELLNKDGLI